MNEVVKVSRLPHTALPTIVKFTASWCGPCKKISPVFRDLADANRHVMCLEVDIDECPNIAREYGVDSVPTFVLMGNRSARIAGANAHGLASLFSRLQ